LGERVTRAAIGHLAGRLAPYAGEAEPADAPWRTTGRRAIGLIRARRIEAPMTVGTSESRRRMLPSVTGQRPWANRTRAVIRIADVQNMRRAGRIGSSPRPPLRPPIIQ
jgi:hypothetical protein